jgi:hypothetical protein
MQSIPDPVLFRSLQPATTISHPSSFYICSPLLCAFPFSFKQTRTFILFESETKFKVSSASLEFRIIVYDKAKEP